MAGVDLPQRAIREQISSAVDFIISVRRYDDGVRRVESVAEITGMEESMPQMQDIFVFRQTGRKDRRVVGEFVATGIVPRRVHELRDRGYDIPLDLFRAVGSTGKAEA